MLIIDQRHHTPWFLYNHGHHGNQQSSFHRNHHQGPWFDVHHSPRTQPSAARLFAGFFVRNLAIIFTTWLILSAVFRFVSFMFSLLLLPQFWVALLVTMIAFPWNLAMLRHRPHHNRNRCGRASSFRRDNCFYRHNACARFQNVQAAPQEKTRSTSEIAKNETSVPPPKSDASVQEEDQQQQRKSKTIWMSPTPFRLEVENEFLTLSIDVPGFQRDDLELAMDTDAVLTVSGKRRNKAGDIVLFKQKIALDKGKVDMSDFSAVKADLSLGVLEIIIPKVKSDEKRDQFRIVPITTGTTTNVEVGDERKDDESDDKNSAGSFAETVEEDDDDDEVLVA